MGLFFFFFLTAKMFLSLFKNAFFLCFPECIWDTKREKLHEVDAIIGYSMYLSASFEREQEFSI